MRAPLLLVLTVASVAAVSATATAGPAPANGRGPAVLASAGPAAQAGTAAHALAHAAKRRHRRRRCDPNYRGRCLRPHVSDYDCAGGGGNGPYYVRGPFRVVGRDHYRLDADHDGIACES